MNFHQVLDEVYIGSYPETVEDIDHLSKKLGVSAVLNLQTDEEMERLECDWRHLNGHYRKSKILVRRIPVKDLNSAELRKSLPDCVQTLNELLRKKHIVYVHSSASIGRAPSVVVTYLNWVHQYDLERAAHAVLQCCPCAPDLEAIRQASQDLLGDAA